MPLFVKANQTSMNSSISPPAFSFYEAEKKANQYLLFHYGSAEETMPFSFGPTESLHFPVRCVTECLDIDKLGPEAKALEVGCAVGRSSFELSRYCKKVIAIDNSRQFISLAKRLQQGEQIEYSIIEEGVKVIKYYAKLPQNVMPERVEFRCCDVMHFSPTAGKFEVVLAANLLCRLPYPLDFLKLLPNWVAPQGQLILISPYSWQIEYTPRGKWPSQMGKSSLEFIAEALQNHFVLKRAFEMPFLLREHARDYQWGVSQATIWQRNTI